MIAASRHVSEPARDGFIALNHLDEDAIENYIFNRLDNSRCLAVERHLRSCSACGQQLRDTQEFITDIKTAFFGLPAPARAVAH
jgi:Putative zinc-finger